MGFLLCAEFLKAKTLKLSPCLIHTATSAHLALRNPKQNPLDVDASQGVIYYLKLALSDMKLILPDILKHIKGLLVMESKKLPLATRILRDVLIASVVVLVVNFTIHNVATTWGWI